VTAAASPSRPELLDRAHQPSFDHPEQLEPLASPLQSGLDGPNRVGLEEARGDHHGVELRLEGVEELEGVAHVLARYLELWLEREGLGRSRHGLLHE